MNLKCVGDNEKYTFDFVNLYFAKKGCVLLETEYINNSSQLKYVCPNGHKSSTTFARFSQGHRCSKCPRKISQNYVRKFFESNGCELIGDYENIHFRKTILTYKCSCGKISEIKWEKFRRGSRCKKCRYTKTSGSGNPNWISNREFVLECEKFRIKSYSLVRMSLLATGQKKNTRTIHLLGYSSEDLKRCIKNHPNWKNVEGKKWHIDHVFPIKAFVDHNITDLSVINHLDNLQPLLSSDNCAKGDCYNEQDFLTWIRGLNEHNRTIVG